MPYLALAILIFFFLKTLFYGLFEIKKNKTGGIVTLIVAIIRTYFSKYSNILFLYILTSTFW